MLDLDTIHISKSEEQSVISLHQYNMGRYRSGGASAAVSDNFDDYLGMRKQRSCASNNSSSTSSIMKRVIKNKNLNKENSNISTATNGTSSNNSAIGNGGGGGGDSSYASPTFGLEKVIQQLIVEFGRLGDVNYMCDLLEVDSLKQSVTSAMEAFAESIQETTTAATKTTTTMPSTTQAANPHPTAMKDMDQPPLFIVF